MKASPEITVHPQVALNLRINEPQLELENEYLTFAPGFQPASVVRDFPLGIEPTERQTFQAPTFVDLTGKEAGLLVLHPGIQYFKRDSDGMFSNLVMREWESYFTGEYGWPRYSEYHHALLPHPANITNADRVRAAEGFSQKLITVVGKPQSGRLAPRKAFISVRPSSAHLMVFRKKEFLWPFGPPEEMKILLVTPAQSLP